MFERFGFAATTLQPFCNDKLCFKFASKCGGAVAVRAMIGTVGKRAFKADRSLKSVLNSSPLKWTKKEIDDVRKVVVPFISSGDNETQWRLIGYICTIASCKVG